MLQYVALIVHTPVWLLSLLPELELTEGQEEFVEAPQALRASSLGRRAHLYPNKSTLMAVHSSSCIIRILLFFAQLVRRCFMHVCFRKSWNAKANTTFCHSRFRLPVRVSNGSPIVVWSDVSCHLISPGVRSFLQNRNCYNIDLI